MTTACTFSEVASAAQIIAPFVHRTPVLTCNYFDQASGRRIYFKCENFQKTGSFKARGALNAVAKLKQRMPECPGVLTHSSGNHGAALSFAAQYYGLPCTVVCPMNAPEAKVNAIKAYNADLVRCDSNMKSRKEMCAKVEAETGRVLIHPHDDYDIMAGQGTVAMEFLEQVPELDAIIVPAGGGGILGGIAVWIKHAKPDCKVFAAEPSGKDLERSLHAGRPLWTDRSATLNTIADGIRVQVLGERCFPTVHEHCEKMVFTVTDAEITDAMRKVYERLKVVIEPTSAVGVAAVLQPVLKNLPNAIAHIGVILCGGNVDLDKLPWLSDK